LPPPLESEPAGKLEEINERPDGVSARLVSAWKKLCHGARRLAGI